jgi:peptidoglycan/xylan/chitin deacetylase (PgdA/CDA1 family)
MDMLERVGVPATFFVPGYDAECYPEVVKEIVRRGHEVGAHGYLHERMVLPPEEEDRRLVLTHDILTNLLGTAPAGWRSPSGQKTYNTLNVLRRLGYRWDSSDKDADMPYLLNLGEGAVMAEIPNNTYSLDDFPWFHFSMTPVSEIVPQWLQEFDAIYADRGYFMLTVHPRSSWGSGGPARTEALEAVIRYAQSHAGVKFVTLSELAGWVLEHRQNFDEVTV